MCITVSIGDIAGYNILHIFRITFKRKRYNIFVTVLFFHYGKVNASFMHTAGSSCFKSPQLHPVFHKAFREINRRQSCVRTAFIRFLSYMNPAFKICSRSNYNSLYLILCTKISSYCLYSAIFTNNLSHFPLLNKKVISFLTYLFHILMVSHSVCLHSKTMNCRTFSLVKHSALYKAFIRRSAHFSSESVYFSYKMSLSSSAY